MITQIYEIQSPAEAESVIAAGVNHVGSVIQSPSASVDGPLRDAIRLVRRAGAVSSLIPLFKQPDSVYRTLDQYQPDMVHFCDVLHAENMALMDQCLGLQTGVRERFPEIAIMRSIPIPPDGVGTADAVLAIADAFEASCDWFLTDTLLGDAVDSNSDQPVSGYVGITGLPCDWGIARALVNHSQIPVVLAGGLSPENVADGIRCVQPAGVDSCTLTNAVDAQGRPIRFQKDMARVAAFVERARNATLPAMPDQGDTLYV